METGVVNEAQGDVEELLVEAEGLEGDHGRPTMVGHSSRWGIDRWWVPLALSSEGIARRRHRVRWRRSGAWQRRLARGGAA
jgi:hypothetical protein